MFAGLRAALSGPSKQDESDKAMLLEGLNSSVTQFLKAHPDGPDAPVARQSPQALELCSAIEDILLHGLRPPNTAGGTQFSILWDFLLKLTHGAMIESLEDLPIADDAGKCRAWIRSALNEGLLISYIESIVQEDAGTSTKSHFLVGAFLRDPGLEKPEIMCTILKSVAGFVFNLSIGDLCLKPGTAPVNDWSDVAAVVVDQSQNPLFHDPDATPAATVAKGVTPPTPRRSKKGTTPRKKKKPSSHKSTAKIALEGELDVPALPDHIDEILREEPLLTIAEDKHAGEPNEDLLTFNDETKSGVKITLSLKENGSFGLIMDRGDEENDINIKFDAEEAGKLRILLDAALRPAQVDSSDAIVRSDSYTKSKSLEDEQADVEDSSTLNTSADVLLQNASASAVESDPCEKTPRELSSSEIAISVPEELPTKDPTTRPPGIVDPAVATVPPTVDPMEVSIPSGIVDPMAATVPLGIVDPMAAPPTPATVNSMDWMILDLAKRNEQSGDPVIDASNSSSVTSTVSQPKASQQTSVDDAEESEEETF